MALTGRISSVRSRGTLTSNNLSLNGNINSDEILSSSISSNEEQLDGSLNNVINYSVVQGGGGSEPEQYLKDAQVNGSTLTITKKDNSTVTFIDTNTTYSAGTNISIDENNVISATGEIGSDWSDISNKPFNTLDTHTLKVTNSILAVNTADDMTGDNTRPMTAAGVNMIVGNINALLEGI